MYNKVTPEFIAGLFLEQKTYEDVKAILQDMFPGERGFSTISIKRFCQKYGISPRVQQNRVQEMVSQSVEGVTTVSLTICFLNLYLLLSVYFIIHFLSISFGDFQMVFVAQI